MGMIRTMVALAAGVRLLSGLAACGGQPSTGGTAAGKGRDLLVVHKSRHGDLRRWCELQGRLEDHQAEVLVQGIRSSSMTTAR